MGFGMSFSNRWAKGRRNEERGFIDIGKAKHELLISWGILKTPKSVMCPYRWSFD